MICYGRFPKFHSVFWAETLAHWNPTSCPKNILNEFVRIRDSQIESSKVEIMETDRIGQALLAATVGFFAYVEGAGAQRPLRWPKFSFRRHIIVMLYHFMLCSVMYATTISNISSPPPT